jgi:hypothetical protein
MVCVSFLFLQQLEEIKAKQVVLQQQLTGQYLEGEQEVPVIVAPHSVRSFLGAHLFPVPLCCQAIKGSKIVIYSLSPKTFAKYGSVGEYHFRYAESQFLRSVLVRFFFSSSSPSMCFSPLRSSHSHSVRSFRSG